MRIALVINHSSGSFRRLDPQETQERIVLGLEAAGHVVESIGCGRRDIAAALNRVAADPGYDLVMTGGGDGTILAAVLAGIGRTVPLGVVPLGTLNLFARDLGLAADPVLAALDVAAGQVKEIDLAEVNGTPFAIWASLGMHPRIVRRRDRLQRSGLSKWPAMVLAMLRAFKRYPMMTANLMVRGALHEVTTPLLVVSNNAWRDEAPPLSRRTLDRGELVVHIARCRTRLGLLGLIVKALLGRWRTSQLLATFTTQELRVSSHKRRVMVSLDGEVMVLRSPLVFRVHPHALKVMMPRKTEA